MENTMPLDDSNPIPQFQSGTIKACVAAIVLNALTLVTQLTGKTFDIDAIQSAVNAGVPMAVNLFSMYLGWRAWQGRKNATQVIAKPPSA
jgi:hypothetical protein